MIRSIKVAVATAAVFALTAALADAALYRGHAVAGQPLTFKLRDGKIRELGTKPYVTCRSATTGYVVGAKLFYHPPGRIPLGKTAYRTVVQTFPVTASGRPSGPVPVTYIVTARKKSHARRIIGSLRFSFSYAVVYTNPTFHTEDYHCNWSSRFSAAPV